MAMPMAIPRSRLPENGRRPSYLQGSGRLDHKPEAQSPSKTQALDVHRRERGQETDYRLPISDVDEPPHDAPLGVSPRRAMRMVEDYPIEF